MKNWILLFSICLLPSFIRAQNESGKTVVCDAVVENGDTVAVIMLGAAIVSDNKRWNQAFQRRYSRLEPKVVKVYPYAKAAGDLMKDYEIELSKLKTDRAKKVFIKNAEEELKQQFEGELTKMTVSEGIILIKLIDRETGDTSYELIQELKGSFSAFMWQTLARLFGHNLKDLYDAEGDDIIIESIVQRIEKNEIVIESKKVDLQNR